MFAVMENLALKKLVWESCCTALKKRIEALQLDEASTRQSAESETKSSAGDKHETAREMVQQEREFIGKRISGAEQQLEELNRIDLSRSHQEVKRGTLLQYESDLLFLATALGPINVGENRVMVISVNSPIGKALLGKKASESFDFQGKKMKIDWLV